MSSPAAIPPATTPTCGARPSTPTPQTGSGRLPRKTATAASIARRGRGWRLKCSAGEIRAIPSRASKGSLDARSTPGRCCGANACSETHADEGFGMARASIRQRGGDAVCQEARAAKRQRRPTASRWGCGWAPFHRGGLDRLGLPATGAWRGYACRSRSSCR